MPKVVTFICNTEGAEVLYSLDGSTPSTTWDGEYVELTEGNYVITALGRKDYYLDSEISTLTVDITPKVTLDLSAVMSLSSMSYFSNTSISISGSEATDNQDNTFTVQTLEYPSILSTPTVYAYLNETYSNVNLSSYINWYADSEYTTLFDFSTSLTEGITLYGRSETNYVKGFVGSAVYGFCSTVEELMSWNGDASSIVGCVLLEDIDLSGQEWTTSSMSGIVDGQSHTISGLTVDSSTSYTGMFRYLYGTVKNLNLTSISISGTSTVGGISAYLSGTISNCSVSGSVSGSGNYVGGLVGVVSTGEVSDSYINSMTVSGTQYVGGIAGWVQSLSSSNPSSISNCNSSSSTISGTRVVGGIVGYCGSNYINITSCANLSNVSGSYYVGGITGYSISSGMNIEACSNGGTITGDFIGGISALNYGNISTCANLGIIQGSSTSTRTGGIAGENQGSVTACRNTGDVSGYSSVGGIVGFNYEGTLTDCNTSSSSISATYCWAGGISGYNLLGTIQDCWTSNVTVSASTQQAGGLVGRLSGGGSVIGCYCVEGSVSVPYGAGGLIGIADTQDNYTDSMKVIASYSASPSVSGSSRIGGLIGSVDSSDSLVGACYTTYSSFIGSNSGTVGMSYYRVNTSTAYLVTIISYSVATTYARTSMNTYLSSNGYDYSYTLESDDTMPLTLS